MTRLTVACVCGAVLAAPAAAQWGQFQGDAQHTGAVAASAGAAITPVWSVTAASLGVVSLNPGAVADGGRVFVSGNVGSSATPGFRDQRLVGLSLATGATNWAYNRPSYDWASSTPAVANGTVYFKVTGHSGVGGAAESPRLVGVNAATGAEQFATSYSNQWGNSSAPTVAGTQVLAMGGYYGGMYGYNATSGGQQWFTNTLPQQAQQVVAADATRAFVYMGSASASPGPEQGTLFAVNRTTGTASAYFVNTPDSGTTYNGLTQNVALGGQNDALFLSATAAGRQLVSVDISGAAGALRWRTAVNMTGALAVGGGKVYVPAGDRLTVLDQATGAVLWSWLAPAGQTLGNNALLTDHLVFVSSAGNTYAVDLSTQQAVWTVADGGMLGWADRNLLVSDADSLAVYFVPVPEPAGLLAVVAVAAVGWRRIRTAGSGRPTGTPPAPPAPDPPTC